MRWIKVTPRSHCREEGGGGEGREEKAIGWAALSLWEYKQKKFKERLKGKNLRRRVVQSTFKQAQGWSENEMMMRSLNI